jgi:hypothetical protein
LDNPYYFDGTYNTVALVWAIGDKTCEEAEKDTGAFAWLGKSDCYDSWSGARRISILFIVVEIVDSRL